MENMWRTGTLNNKLTQKRDRILELDLGQQQHCGETVEYQRRGR